MKSTSEQQGSAPQAGVSPLQAPRGNGRTVLVVDDDVDAADTLAQLLRAWGYGTVVAHDGPEALAAAQQWAPEFALLDLGMPSMDGYELAAHLRFQDGSHGMRVIAVTGRDQDEDTRRSRTQGFAAHLVKPIDMHRLATLLA